jgi:hypothetical protein
MKDYQQYGRVHRVINHFDQIEKRKKLKNDILAFIGLIASMGAIGLTLVILEECLR